MPSTKPKPTNPTSQTDFLVHDERDDVGVVVVEGVQADQELCGWLMQGDQTIHLTTHQPIPLGHKVALKNIAKGSDIIKYGEVIGIAVADISAGSHLHVHNTKTKKW